MWMRSAASKGCRVSRVSDYGRRAGRWLALGRLLPRDVRERIFDPAFSDLMRAWLTASEGRRRLPFAVHAVGIYAGCFPIAIPRLFLDHGRLTRFGRASLVVIGVGATVALVVANLAEFYASYSP